MPPDDVPLLAAAKYDHLLNGNALAPASQLIEWQAR